MAYSIANEYFSGNKSLSQASMDISSRLKIYFEEKNNDEYIPFSLTIADMHPCNRRLQGLLIRKSEKIIDIYPSQLYRLRRHYAMCLQTKSPIFVV